MPLERVDVLVVYLQLQDLNVYRVGPILLVCDPLRTKFSGPFLEHLLQSYDVQVAR